MFTTRTDSTRTCTLLGVSVAMLLAAAACGGSSSPEATKADASSSSKIKTIQFVNPLPNYPTWKLVGDCMKKAAEARDVKLTQSGPTGQAIDAPLMVSQISQATANKVGAIVTLPASEAFGPVLKQAQKAGVLTGTYYGSGEGADVNIAPDWTAIGEQMVEGVAKIPGDHKVGLVAAANVGLGKQWLDGMKAAAKKTDNVEIVGEVYTGDDATKALPQVSALLTSHPEVTDIMTHMGTTTPGAVAAIKQKKLQGKTFLVAGGHDNGGLEAMKEGTARLMLMQAICPLAEQMVNDLVDKSEGKDVPVSTATIVMAGKDEVQSYLDKGYS
jgi:ABC-type sugar transport system substrate-binding protein